MYNYYPVESKEDVYFFFVGSTHSKDKHTQWVPAFTSVEVLPLLMSMAKLRMLGVKDLHVK